jgi:MFS family permease
VASAGGSIGLLAGGVLTDLINWHWIFFVNVPIGLLTAVLALRLVESRPGIGFGEGADAPGAVLVTGGLMLTVYTILGVEEHGWTSARTLILAAVSLGLVAAFIVRQARIEKPLMPLRLFRSRNVSGANIVMALLVVGMFGIFFLGALYMQLVLGYEPLEVGLAFLPGSLLMGLLSLGFTDKVNMRFGPRRVLITGLCLLLVAILLFARTPVDGNYWTDLFPPLFIFGAGAGVAFPALMMLAMSGATPQDAGLASGLVNTTGQVGGAIGLAVLATLSTERTASLLADGESQAAALNGGFHLAYLIGAGAAALAIIAAVTVLRSESPAGAMADAHGEPGAPDQADARGEPAYDPA